MGTADVEPSLDIMIGDVFEMLAEVPAGSVHVAVTSPPYWGLRSYLPKGSKLKKYELGSEKTPELWAARQVEVFREVRRVLRDDGTCWVNVGDCYAGSSGSGGKTPKQMTNKGSYTEQGKPRGLESYKPGDRICQGYMLAEALRRDGWYLRQTIIWAKGLAFNKYRDDTQVLLWDEPELLDTDAPGSVMPESTSGWRYERCRVKVRARPEPKAGTYAGEFQHGLSRQAGCRDEGGLAATWQDCPGCKKCVGTLGPDLYVLRKGSWRTTSSYELLLHLAKSKDYYGDGDAVRESAKYGRREWKGEPLASAGGGRGQSTVGGALDDPGAGRNLRSVWVIPTKSYKGSHYATYPEALVVPIIKSSTSERGVCPKCGSPWARVVDVSPMVIRKSGRAETTGNRTDAAGHMEKPREVRVIAWHPTCTCGGSRKRKPIPATVLDPYAGSGTTLKVAFDLGRSAIGIDLDPRNEPMMKRRLLA